MLIKLGRYGPSLANKGDLLPHESGDADIPFAGTGQWRSRVAEFSIGSELLGTALRFRSPYLRTRQTLKEIFAGDGMDELLKMKIYADPRLREVERVYLYETTKPRP